MIRYWRSFVKTAPSSKYSYKSEMYILDDYIDILKSPAVKCQDLNE